MGVASHKVCASFAIRCHGRKLRSRMKDAGRSRCQPESILDEKVRGLGLTEDGMMCCASWPAGSLSCSCRTQVV